MAAWWDNYDFNLGDIFSHLGDLAGGFRDLPRDVPRDVGWFFDQFGGLFTDTSGQAPAAQQAAGPTGQAPPDISSLLRGLLGGAAGGGGRGAPAGPAGYTTPDGVFIADGSPQDRYYKLVDAVWTRVFGAHPGFAQARIFHDMGIENTDQLNQVILSMPSHIKAPDGNAISIGVYENMLQVGNKASQQYTGRPVPDSLIKQWVADGVTEPAAIQNWFFSHPTKDIPLEQYGQIWDAANDWTQDMSTRFR